MKYSGIKRIDEAQSLLMQEAKENGMEFCLVVKAKDDKHGFVFKGDPLNIGATMALLSRDNEPLRESITLANRAMNLLGYDIKKKDLSVSRCWLARDKDGDAALYRRKPTKYPEQGMWDDPKSTDFVFMPDNFLPLGINPKWEDEEPTEIEIRKPKE